MTAFVPSNSYEKSMKVLVYGAGVVGSALIHVLCLAGNDVAVAARGRILEQLKVRRLWLHLLLKRKHTVDFSRVVDVVSAEESFDVVFSVMQNQQQLPFVETLAVAGTPYVILVGNNLIAAEVEAGILARNATAKMPVWTRLRQDAKP